MPQKQLLKQLKGGLIVSCQALEGEPLYGEDIMARLAISAERGGAIGIRANSPIDIAAIKKSTELPLIGLWKRHYPDSDVYITPTLEDVKAVIAAGADVVAMDATLRRRPGEVKLEEIVRRVKKEHASILLMADVSTIEEGVHAVEIGFDLVSTTLSGYTPYSPMSDFPDSLLIESLVQHVSVPVIAEGRVRTPEQARGCLKLGAYAVVVGGAITRPQEITQRFVSSLSRP